MRGSARRVTRVACWLVIACGVAAAALGAWQLVCDHDQAQGYAELAAAAGPGSGPSGDLARETDEVGWDSLLAANPDVCAWLTVGGTSVDVPVVQATDSEPDRWLYRDLWGSASDTGTPYLDHRCSADGRVMYVYGHRTLYSDYMFHDLSGAFRQQAFSELGDALWDTPDGSRARFSPLCAASVDMSDADWQNFGAKDADQLRAWLSWALSASSAQASDAQELASKATRALVLVTCNGRISHPTTRTVTVFVQ